MGTENYNKEKQIANTILRDFLIQNGSQFEKYLYKVNCFNSKSETNLECFITPVLTKSGNNVLIVTKLIESNWYDSIKDINNQLLYLNKNLYYSPNKYKYLLHAYFSSIDLEQFYRINVTPEFLLSKITLGQLEIILQ